MLLDPLIDFALAHKTATTLIATPILAGLVTGIGFLIKRYCFPDKEKLPKVVAEINAEGNFTNSGVMATGGSVIKNAVAGDQHLTLYVYTKGAKPTAPEDEKNVDRDGRQEVEAMLRRAPTLENKQYLLKKFRDTEDRGLKVQIAHVFGVWFDPSQDATLELIELTTEAIEHARTLNAKPVLAALLGYKGAYTSMLFVKEFAELYVKQRRGVGKGTIAFLEREMKAREQVMEECFSKAEQVAKDSGSYEAIAIVQIDIGQAAGNRAAAFAHTDLARSQEEKKRMREAFHLAEKAYTDVADRLVKKGELEIANVKHNLVNCLRMFGKEEIEEAKSLERDVIEVAKRYGDRTLLWKANAIMDRLNGKSVPDYYNGEEGESLI